MDTASFDKQCACSRVTGVYQLLFISSLSVNKNRRSKPRITIAITVLGTAADDIFPQTTLYFVHTHTRVVWRVGTSPSPRRHQRLGYTRVVHADAM
jgi:hypothetical protein